MADNTQREITLPEVAVTPEMEKALNDAVSPEEIREIISQEAAKQNIVIPRDDKGRFTAEKREEKVDAKEDESFVYEDDFVIGGKSYHFEGDSPADISRQVKAAIAAHENAINPEKKQEPAVAKKGLTADEKVSLQLDMQLGRITPEEYLEKTGYLDTYLENKGIKVDELKEVVEEKKTKRQESAWQSATDSFLKMEGNDWPGGDQNLKVIGYKLAELGLSDKPSPESLKKAYDAMKADNLVFKPEPKATETKVDESQQTKKKLSGSSMFGVGGGSAAKDRTDKTQTKLPEITPEMSPREIMELYKQAALANGQNPDEVIFQSQRR